MEAIHWSCSRWSWRCARRRERDGDQRPKLRRGSSSCRRLVAQCYRQRSGQRLLKHVLAAPAPSAPARADAAACPMPPPATRTRALSPCSSLATGSQSRGSAAPLRRACAPLTASLMPMAPPHREPEDSMTRNNFQARDASPSSLPPGIPPGPARRPHSGEMFRGVAQSLARGANRRFLWGQE